MHQGSNNFINQFYINIKTSSSSIKMNYYAHVSPDGVFDWQNIKPTKSKLKFKGYVEDDLANARVPLSWSPYLNSPTNLSPPSDGSLIELSQQNQNIESKIDF